MRISIVSSFKMIMKEEEFEDVGNTLGSASSKQIHKSLLLPSTPTLNFLSIILIILYFSCENIAYGHPLLAREDGQSNNDYILGWRLLILGKDAARQKDNSRGIGKATVEERIKGLNLDNGHDDGNDGWDGAELPELEESSGSNQPSMYVLMNLPRKKKGLSYLSKFYSEALLHHNSGHVGNSSKEAQYFGERFGSGTGASKGINASASSGEHSRFPSNVRRKLSFYPPLTLMSPWRGIFSGSSSGVTGSGRQANMRLRWGK